MAATATSKWRSHRQRVYQSVFQTNISLPTPYSTPSLRVTEQGQPFGGHLPLSQLDRQLLHGGTGVASSAALDGQGQPPQHSLGGGIYPPYPNLSSSGHAPSTSEFPSSSQPPAPPLFPVQNVAEDQIRYDRAWHVLTSRIGLPSSATAEDSFGTLAPDSQYLSQGQGASSEAEFYDALQLVVNARTALPWAGHTEDIVGWHTQQVRRHFAHHVVPLLSACAGGQSEIGGSGADGDARRDNYYEQHMVAVMSSVRTLEAALRLYSYGLQLIIRGLQRLKDKGEDNPSMDPELITTRFRRDVHALVNNSTSPALMSSLRFVLVRLVGNILGVPAADAPSSAKTTRPAPPTDNDLNSLAARKRLLELIEPLYNVGLAGEKFQILFAEVMDRMMADFVRGAYAGIWTASSQEPDFARGKTAAPITGTTASEGSPCITSLCDWVENHYARLAFEVLSRITDPQPSTQPPVTLADVKTYQSLALGCLAALRISELFDIVLAWPVSRGALDDLRVAITTPTRRLQLTDSFTAELQRRLLHPGRSTLDILQTYIAIIRTFHALDHSKVLLTRVAPKLQLYLCGREDAVRTVVTGLLASPEEIRAARIAKTLKQREASRGTRSGSNDDSGPFMTPAIPGRATSSRPETPPLGKDESDGEGMQNIPTGSAAAAATPSNKLVELALLLTDPAQSRRAMGPEDDTDLDWDDMTWVPDPVDAGANYKRPRSEDVIGTLISALGSQDVFIREFQVSIADRLLSDQVRFEQETRVLNLLKKRFGDAALQNCDVMMRDILESRRLDAAIRKGQGAKGGEPKQPAAATPTNVARVIHMDEGEKEDATTTAHPYHARILSRLFWPNLDREHFLLPTPVVELQKSYEGGYEHIKSSRKLTWLNQLGQATVELELEDRTVTTECKTYEATVIYAFQNDEQGSAASSSPARRSVEELTYQLQMDDDLIVSALNFWVSKGVLRRSQGDTYTVVETLSQPDDAGPRSPAGEEDQQGDGGEGSRKAQMRIGPEGKEQQARRQMYWQYIRGMLTNSSATMPLAQMAMMLKMLIPDGFPWSNEELLEFLTEKVGEGALEVVGGKYKLVRE